MNDVEITSLKSKIEYLENENIRLNDLNSQYQAKVVVTKEDFLLVTID